MAILFYTGWEAGSIEWYIAQQTALWAGNAVINVASVGLHRNLAGEGGNYSIQLDDTWVCANNTVVAGTARWKHFWYFGGTLFSAFLRSGSVQCGAFFNSDGSIAIWRGGSLLQTFHGCFQPYLAHWVAISADISNAGTLLIYIDDVLILTFIGDIQEHATLSGWDSFGWGHLSGGPGFFNSGSYVDDVVITDTTTGRLTEKKVFVITANGDSTPLLLTPSTGTNHAALIDEIPLNDADFNNTGTTLFEDFYTWTTIPTTSSITALQFSARVTNDSGLTQGQIRVRSNVTTVSQTAVTLTVSPTFRGISYMLEQDPDTVVAWTDGGIAAVEAGIRFTL